MAVVVGRAVTELVVLGLSVLHSQVRSGFTQCPAKSDLGSLNVL